jgi:hypothetical protein
MGQYSCSNLLKELEAADSESGEENFMIVDGDDELVKIHDSWLDGVGGMSDHHGLPENLYEIPEMAERKCKSIK